MTVSSTSRMAGGAVGWRSGRGSGPAKYDALAGALLQERPPDGRAPGDVAALHVDLVFAHDAITRGRALLVFDLDEGAEEGRGFVVFHLRGARVHDGGVVEALGEPLDATVDLAELALAVDVLGVLAAVALGGGVGDVADDGGALAVAEGPELLLQLLRAVAGDVVRDLLARLHPLYLACASSWR